MPDDLLSAWLALRAFVAQPEIAAALTAMLTTGIKVAATPPPRAKHRWFEVPLVGLAAFSITPVALSVYGEPSWGALVGFLIGFYGAKKLEDKLDGIANLFLKGGKK